MSNTRLECALQLTSNFPEERVKTVSALTQLKVRTRLHGSRLSVFHVFVLYECVSSCVYLFVCVCVCACVRASVCITATHCLFLFRSFEALYIGKTSGGSTDKHQSAVLTTHALTFRMC